MKIFCSAWFGRFAKREHIPARSLLDAVARAERGRVDADLGGRVIKQRIARPGEGKSKGYRSIILFGRARAFFVYGFSKSDMGNIGADEERQFKKMARHVLALTDKQLSELIINGQFEEVVDDGREISR